RAGDAASGTGSAGRLMFAQDFMRNALLASTFIALACGVSGWFVVLRAQVFAGDALSHVAFPGALAAAAAGVDRRIGLFAARWAAALALAATALTAAIARPLLFASVAPDLAAARGVRTRLLDVGFAALLGVIAAEATQAVGALLLLGLLAVPAAAAHRIAAR